MKSPVLSAWIAAGLVLAASGARAQQADCDLVCRLQGYLSTDHMAAPAGGAAPPSAGAPVKRHPHAAATAPKTGLKVATKTQPVADAKVSANHPLKAAAKASAKTAAAVEPAAAAEPRPPKAVASTPANELKSALQAPHPANLDPASIKPPKHRAVAAIATPSDPPSAPSAVVTSPRSRRKAPAAPRFARQPASTPLASADLIPGSARLVPAEFQAFGNL